MRERPVISVGILTLTVMALTLSGCGSRSSVHTAAGSGLPTSALPVGFEVNATANPTLGPILVDPTGMTLYRNTGEGGGTVVCTGGCSLLWPPLLLPSGVSRPSAGPGVTGGLATILRPDGGSQVTYNGQPLYRYANDHRPGDANGQGVGGVWLAVETSAIAPPTTVSTAPPTTGVAAQATTAPTSAPLRRVTPATTTPYRYTPVTSPPATSPPATSPPATTPPTTAYRPPTTPPPPTAPPTTMCYYPPCH